MPPSPYIKSRPSMLPNGPELITTPAEFISTYYSNGASPDPGRVVRITPFKRNVFVSSYRAYIADFEEYKWLLQHGNTDVWYEKPKKSWIRHQDTLEASGCEPEELAAMDNARPVSLDTPRVWASPALTTPTDDDIFDCIGGHSIDDGFTGACPTCTDEKAEALDSTPLVYYLVLSTCQASDPFLHGAHFNGKPIYKLIKCGSRDAAVAEAFYSSGLNGWTVAFSCVMRVDETFEERDGKIKRVDDLWMLAEEEDEDDSVRVFF